MAESADSSAVTSARDRLATEFPTAGLIDPSRTDSVRTRLPLPGPDGTSIPRPAAYRCSLAISTGANIKAIQRMLGHKNASMTLDRYGHLFIEDLSDLADRLDEKYRGAA